MLFQISCNGTVLNMLCKLASCNSYYMVSPGKRSLLDIVRCYMFNLLVFILDQKVTKLLGLNVIGHCWVQVKG